MMLSINSTLHEIQQAHRRDKMNMKQIARALGVGENKLRRILTSVGFEYDASLKEWRYTNQDDGAVLQRSFWSLDEYGVGKTRKDNTSNTDNMKSNKSNKGNTNDDNTGNIDNINSNTGNPSNTDNSNTDNTGNTKEGKLDNMGNMIFTQDEIMILKELAARHAEAAPAKDSTDIIMAIASVPKGKTTKKTFAINDGIVEQLDAFCDAHRVGKSDFIMMAIQDALNKYDI